MAQPEFDKELKKVPGLSELINELHNKQDAPTKLFLTEFALHGLAEYSLISKHNLTAGLQFKDLLSSMFTLPRPDENEDGDDEAYGGNYKR
jgi:magnesium chelatase subunit I